MGVLRTGPTSNELNQKTHPESTGWELFEFTQRTNKLAIIKQGSIPHHTQGTIKGVRPFADDAYHTPARSWRRCTAQQSKSKLNTKRRKLLHEIATLILRQHS